MTNNEIHADMIMNEYVDCKFSKRFHLLYARWVTGRRRSHVRGLAAYIPSQIRFYVVCYILAHNLKGKKNQNNFSLIKFFFL